MDSTSLTKPVDLQGLSLALAKTKADYEGKIDTLTENLPHANVIVLTDGVDINNVTSDIGANVLYNNYYGTNCFPVTVIYNNNCYAGSIEYYSLDIISYTLFFGDYAYVTSTSPYTTWSPVENIGADWVETSTYSNKYIQNKPAIKAGEGENSVLIGQIEQDEDAAVYHISFDYPTAATDTVAFTTTDDLSGLTDLDYLVCKILFSFTRTSTGKTTEYTRYYTINNLDVVNSTITFDRNLTVINGGTFSSVDGTLYFKYKSSYGKGAVAEGLETFAADDYNHAEGRGTKALGSYSHAEGCYTNVSGSYSHAEGYHTNASNSCSHAEGCYTNASGYHSHAEGNYTTASGINSHTEGNYTTASNKQAHASGFYSVASGDTSYAEGFRTLSTGLCSHAEGMYHVVNATLTGEANALTYNVGTDVAIEDSTWLDRIIVYYSNKYYKPTAITLSDGKLTTITLEKTLNASAAFNATVTIDFGSYARAQGSHAEGGGSYAKGNASHAEGLWTTAIGDGSHAEGYRNTATGGYSHAEGRENNSTGSYSHAEGAHNNAIGTYSHAEGLYTISDGDASHAEGYYTIASSDASYAGGKFNIEDTNEIYAHIVGNGTATDARSNAYTLDWSGNGWYAGKVSAGTVESPANPTAANDLATKAYVDAATAGVSPNLSGLADTNISNPADGQVLKYDSTSSKWVNGNSNEILYATITGNASDGYSIDKTFTEMKDALNNGKQVIAINSGYYYHCTWTTGSYILLSSQTLFATSSPYIGFRVFTYKNDGTLTYYASSLQNKIANFNISSPSEGQVLSYDATNSQWINTNAVTETRVNELIAAALAQYGDGDTATYGYNDASEVNY